ncbi:MAG: ABC transporter substrate-binding protein [Bacteroidales bacterium]|nr:ABC transporter substrate-binding protein [Bacteroidales bacterium]
MQFFDGLGRTICLDKIPKRIVSLCPSITETLCELGLADKIIACTDYCVHPIDVVKNFNKIGGPKNFSEEKILNLKPDIIFAVKEENETCKINRISKKVPTYVFDINSIQEGIEMIKTLGNIFEIQNISDCFIEKMQEGYKNLTKVNSNIKCLYLVWKQPYIAVGGDSFIDSVLYQINIKNCLRNSKKKYPKIKLKLLENQFDLLILPSEPYSFSENDIDGFEKIFPEKEIIKVDGEMFSWYGTHQLKAISYLQKLVINLNSKK